MVGTNPHIFTKIQLGVVLLLLSALVFPAPWRLPAATNDEMLHLKSWRNRYGTDDVFPIGRRKLERATNVPEPIKKLALRIYDSGPLGQRLFIVLQDCHPSIWPVTAEFVASVTNSSLIAIRLLSTVAFALALLLLYRVGQHLADWKVGLALAAFWTLSHLALEYAGLARMYACAFAALLWFLYIYLTRDPQKDRDFTAISLWAILPVSLEWFTWPAVYTLLAVAVLRRAHGVKSVGDLWRKYKALAPFLVVCTLWLGYYFVLAKFHPSLSPEWSEGKGPYPAYQHLGDFFARVGIFSYLYPGRRLSTEWIALLNVAILALGLGVFSFRRQFPLPLRLAVVFLTVAGLILPNFIRMLARHYWLTLTVPITMAYLGFALLVPQRWRLTVPLVLLLGGLVVAFTEQKFLGKDNPAYEFPQIAGAVKDALGEDSLWIASPYQLAMCIYRYQSLPEPELPSSRRELEMTLEQMPCDRDIIVLCHKWTPLSLSEQYRNLFENGIRLREFANGIAIFRIHKKSTQNNLTPNGP